MRSATGTTPSIPSALPRTGRRHSVGQQRTPTGTVMRRPSCGFTAAMGRTRRWTSERSHVSIRPCKMPNLTATSGSDACFTTTSRGQPRPRCLITTTQRKMCRTVCTSRSGPGTDSLVARRPATYESVFPTITRGITQAGVGGNMHEPELRSTSERMNMSASEQIKRSHVRDLVSPEEWQVRVDLAAAYRLVASYGWDDLVFTHISARVPGPQHHFLINPYGMMFEEITASSLVKVDLNGEIVMKSDYK